MRILIIDDLKNIEFNNTEVYSEVVRTFEAGLEKLKTELWDVLYLDHDLGIDDLKKTGFDILRIGLEQNVIPGQVEIISLNPVGVKRMENILKDYHYKQITNKRWKLISL